MSAQVMRFPKDMTYSDYIEALGKPKVQIQKSPYSSSTSVNMGTGYFTFEIEGQQVNMFAESKSIYLNWKISNDNDGAMAFPAHLGAYSMINRIIIETSTGVKISEITNFNNLMNIKIDESADLTWLAANKMSLGTDASWSSTAIVSGDAALATKAAFDAGNTVTTSVNMHSGHSIAAGEDYYVSLPIQLNLLANSSYLPLEGIEGIRFKVYFDTSVASFIGASAAGANTPINADITISEPLLVYDVVELTDAESDALRGMNNYKYVLTGSDYQNQYTTLTATGANSASITLGFSKRLAKKLYGSFRTDAFTTYVQHKNHFSRNKLTLSEITLLYNGHKVKQKQQSLTVDANSSMVWIENRKASHGCMNMIAPSLNSTNFNLAEGTGVSTAQ